MKIVVLNECFLSDDNLSYLRTIAEVEIFNDTTDEATAITRLAGADIAFADMYECPLNEKVLSSCRRLKLLVINSTSYDLVDLKAAAANDIAVANIPGFSTEAVAEHAFALLLGVQRHLVEAQTAMKAKPFQINPADQSHYKFLGFNLHGKTFGIIGLGAIGAHAARIAQGFGMKVIASNRSAKKIDGVEMVSLDDLFARADIVSLHTPLNDGSQNIINAASIQKMKTGVIVLNTARGGCIVSSDLADALASGKVAGAGLDTLDVYAADNPLLHAPHVTITPHSAWFTREALANIGDIMTNNVKNFLANKPCNKVTA